MRKLLCLALGCVTALCFAAASSCKKESAAPAANASPASSVPAASSPQQKTAPATVAAEKGRPLYYDHELDPDKDLAGRTLRELSLMRNTIYARAGNPFRKKWLNDYFSAQPWYKPLDKMDPRKLGAFDNRNAELIAFHDASLTRDDLVAMQKSVGDPKTEADKIELRLLSVRLGHWLGPDAPDKTPLEDPSLLDRQITVEQLADFSRRDLRLLRNMVYARHGRPFHSELLQNYFGTMDWYKADASYTEARLSALDARNIKLIRSVEDQLGGPLSDMQQKVEDGWFANA